MATAFASCSLMAQLFYNHRLTQRRSRSEKPEYAYNLDLAWQLLADHQAIPSAVTTQERNDDWLSEEIVRPLLSFNDDRAELKRDFCERNGLETTRKLVFIHPGSGGSATNLRAEQYAQLANLLSASEALAFVISAGPGERAVAEQGAGVGVADVLVPGVHRIDPGAAGGHLWENHVFEGENVIEADLAEGQTGKK